jgi:hypothetical protein
VKAEFKGVDDPEVATPTANPPEEIRVLVQAGLHEFSICRYDIGRKEVIGGKTIFTAKPAEATAECQSGDASGRDDAARCGKAECLRLVVNVTPGGATLDAGSTCFRIDIDSVHQRQIDHEDIVLTSSLSENPILRGSVA